MSSGQHGQGVKRTKDSRLYTIWKRTLQLQMEPEALNISLIPKSPFTIDSSQACFLVLIFSSCICCCCFCIAGTSVSMALL